MNPIGTIRRDELLQHTLAVYKAGGDPYTLDLFLTLWGLKEEFQRQLRGPQAVTTRKVIESEADNV